MKAEVLVIPMKWISLGAIAGVLKAYDLPDLIGSIAPRKIALVDLQDQMLDSVAGLTCWRRAEISARCLCKEECHSPS